MSKARAPRAENPTPASSDPIAGTPGQAERRLGAMTWCEVRDALDRRRDRVVVPFGACEQHGAHLPLDTDTLLGDRLGLLLADRIDALCAPTVPIGCSEHHMSRTGTLSLQPATLTLIVHDVVSSLARHGFRTIVLLPTHAGNAAPIAHSVRNLDPPADVRVVVVADMGALAAALHRAGEAGEADAATIAHAGEIETSMMLALAPAAIRPGARQGVEAGEAGGRAYVAAYLGECVKQLEAEGVTARCASA